MLDFIKISTKIANKDDWQQQTGLQLSTTVDAQTKETVKYSGEYGSVSVYDGKTGAYSYKIIERESYSHFNKTCRLIVGGSLHKGLCGENYSRFSWSQLQEEILNVQRIFNINADDTMVNNMEIGVNIPVPFQPYSFLDSNLISYKGKERRKYLPNRVNGSVIGFEIPLKQYRVKVYDKGIQNRLDYELLRFELHYSKMQPITRSIGALPLSELQLKERVGCLFPMLIKAWNNILLYDDSIDLTCLEHQEAYLLSFGRSPKNWQDLRMRNLTQYKNDMQKFKKLVANNGCQNHKMIHDLICAEWEWLINN